MEWKVYGELARGQETSPEDQSQRPVLKEHCLYVLPTS